MIINPILKTDSYKESHWKQYPKDTKYVHSYLESRGGLFPKTVFFGMQYIIQEHLTGRFVTSKDVEEADEYCKLHFGQDLLNVDGWYGIVDDHAGRLPLSICAVPEGSVNPVSTPLMTMENTDPEYAWVTNTFETLASQVWYPTTVAAQSKYMKQIILNGLQQTGTPEDIQFKLHDFGFRGVSSLETAAIGGSAHLVNFMGTDTMPALQLLKEHYSSECAGFSIALFQPADR